jgi:hypothetical protein
VSETPLDQVLRLAPGPGEPPVAIEATHDLPDASGVHAIVRGGKLLVSWEAFVAAQRCSDETRTLEPGSGGPA